MENCSRRKFPVPFQGPENRDASLTRVDACYRRRTPRTIASYANQPINQGRTSRVADSLPKWQLPIGAHVPITSARGDFCRRNERV